MDAPSDRLSVSDSSNKSRLGDVRGVTDPDPLFSGFSAGGGNGGADASGSRSCWSASIMSSSSVASLQVGTNYAGWVLTSTCSSSATNTNRLLRRRTGNPVGNGDAVGGSIESGSVDGTALLPSPTLCNTCSNAPEKLEMTTMTLSCDRRHRFRVNRNRFETWGQPSLAGTATLPHSMAWDGARQTGISGMDPPFSATWSVCGKNWALDVMLRRPWLLPIPTSCVLYWLPHSNCFLYYFCLLRPGLSRTGLSRPGLNRPGLNRSGLSWKKKIGLTWIDPIGLI